MQGEKTHINYWNIPKALYIISDISVNFYSGMKTLADEERMSTSLCKQCTGKSALDTHAKANKTITANPAFEWRVFMVLTMK